jgi:MFS family permease
MGVGLFIRLCVLESPLFDAMKAGRPPAPLPILVVLRNYRRNVLLAMGARFAENTFFYILTVFSLSYATQQLQVSKATVLNAVLMGSGLQFIAIPLFGAWSDRIGRRPVYLGGAVFLTLFAFPFFWLVDTRNTAAIWLAIGIGLIGHAAMYGPQAAFFSELFGTHVRYSGASLGYQLASPLAGGLAPLIATALLQQQTVARRGLFDRHGVRHDSLRLARRRNAPKESGGVNTRPVDRDRPWGPWGSCYWIFDSFRARHSR